MSEEKCIKLVEFNNDEFRKLTTGEKLLLLLDAENTTVDNCMILQRQLARIQKLQYECNQMKIFQLESESIPLPTPKEISRKRRREEEARERSRQIEVDMAQGRNVYNQNEGWRVQKSIGISKKTKFDK